MLSWRKLVMLFRPVIFYAIPFLELANPYIHARPMDGLNVPALSSVDVDLQLPNSCDDLSHCRTVWNIIWSCLVTISLCCWVLIHPDVPQSRGRGPLHHILRHVIVAAEAALVPEWTITWTLHQWFSVRNVCKEVISMSIFSYLECPIDAGIGMHPDRAPVHHSFYTYRTKIGRAHV